MTGQGPRPEPPCVTPPDPGQARTLDDLVEMLRSLKVWAGDPSYDTIKGRVNIAWTSAGRPASDLTKKTTVADCFKTGRRRLNNDLVLAVVEALHSDVGYVAQWRQALRVVGGEIKAVSQVRVQDTLPQDLATFTGRFAELHRLGRLLHRATQGGGAVVISAIEGMAGVGKTQLAIHTAHLLHQEENFERLLFVNLRGFHPDPAQPPADPAAVLDGFLCLLGVPAQQIPHDLEGRTRIYRARLAGTRSLVILDNASSADQVRPLLPEIPGCPVLVTSRRGLHDLHCVVHIAVDVFTPREALDFLARATPRAAVGEDPEAAARIAERCGYLPLALGLIAGHIRNKPGWTLTDHADWLDDRHNHRRLDTGLEVAFGLSYNDLPIDRRHLLRLLALHPAQDFDAYAAAALADTDLEDARRQLDRLRDDHLLQQGTPGRYTFHDLIRAYATTRAHDEDRPSKRRTALTRLFDYYLAAAAVATDALYPAEAADRPRVVPSSGPLPELADPDTALAWVDTERHVLVAVAAHTATHGWPTHAVQLARVLYRYLNGAHLTDALTVHGHAGNAARISGDLVGQASALADLGAAHWMLGRPDSATGYYAQALDLFQQAGDLAGQSRVYHNLAVIEAVSGQHEKAAEHYGQMVALCRQLGDRTSQATAFLALGHVAMRSGREEAAAEHYTQALALVRDTRSRIKEAAALNGLGEAQARLGLFDPAAEHLARALDLFRQLGHRRGEADVLDALGYLHTRTGQLDLATEHHQQELTISRDLGYRQGEAYALNGLGEAAQAAGRPTDALAHHTDAHTVAVDAGHRDQQARAHAGLSHAHRSLGNQQHARWHYEAAAALYDELGTTEAERLRSHLSHPAPGPETGGVIANRFTP